MNCACIKQHCPYIKNLTFAVAGTLGKLPSRPKPFDSLRKEDLVRELAARGFDANGKKDELEDMLKKELHGTQRVLSLMYRYEMRLPERKDCTLNNSSSNSSSNRNSNNNLKSMVY